MNVIRTKCKAEFFLKSAGVKVPDVEVCEDEVIITIDTKKTVQKKKGYRMKDVIEKVLELFDFYMIDLSSITLKENGMVEVCIRSSSVFFNDDFDLNMEEVIKKSPFGYKKRRMWKII